MNTAFMRACCVAMPASLLLACQPSGPAAEAPTAEAPPAMSAEEAKIADALSAITEELAASARVVDWDGTVLREGSGPYHCMPTPPELAGGGARAPMCMDDEWMKWAQAWSGRTDFKASKIGISYMLAGDGGASNIDPYATAETPDNDWVVEGPHLMVIVPDPAMLEGISTDPHNGGPYVMWKGTPYAHVMVPVR